MNILVVEDNPDIAEYLSIFLKTLGYSPVLATSRDAALTHLRTFAPAAIVMDWHMPGLGLREFLSNEAMDDFRHRTILYSGDSDGALCASEFKLRYFLQKPFEPQTLRRMLHRCSEPDPAHSSGGLQCIAST